MHQVCGLEIKWTHCLSEHLFLKRGRRKTVLMVFPYKASLAELLANTDWASSPTPATIPKTVLAETIESLNLLFPLDDPATTKFLHDHQEDFHLYPPHDEPKTLNLKEFDIWRDRLFELHEVVFSAPPVSWKQLWFDRRNPQLFWTFWLALFIAMINVVSAVASIWQAAKS